jgi:hypothetical protein
MDPIFLHVCFLLAGGAFEESCPGEAYARNGTKPLVLGAVLSKRRNNTRIEIWLGGVEAPNPAWIRLVEQFIGRAIEGQQVFPYRAFKAGTERSERGGKRP